MGGGGNLFPIFTLNIGQNGLKCRKEISVKKTLNFLRKLKMLRMDQGKVSKNPFHQVFF